MAKTLILLLLAMRVAQAQQTSPKAPQQNVHSLYDAAWDGDKMALQQLRIRAEQGQIDAQSLLGRLYFFPLSKVPEDCAEATRWSRKGAEQGNAFAQFSLGMLYGGFCGPEDQVEELRWYRKAAEQGSPEAQSIVGDMYTKGEGAPRDYSEAVRWYRKAADAGLSAAQYSLGAMYEKGQGIPADLAQAVKWYRRAADNNDGLQSVALAQSRLREIDSKKSVPMVQGRGVYAVPVLINNAITLNFVVDSGAADVSIPADVVTTLMRAGTIAQSDFIGTQTYSLADGSTTSSRTFRIRSLKVGDMVLQNVMGSVANAKGDLLLGQSFLGRFKSWSIDNAKHALVLE